MQKKTSKVTKLQSDKVESANSGVSDMVSAMRELGTTQGSGDNARMDALLKFASIVKGGNSNSFPVDPKAETKIMDPTIRPWATAAVTAYCAAVAAKTKRPAMNAGSQKTFATQMVAAGMLSVRQPDLIDTIAATVLKFVEGKTKKETFERSTYDLFYRALVDAKELHEKSKPLTPELVEKAGYVKAAIGRAKKRGSSSGASETPANKLTPEQAAKASLLELAEKFGKDETVPANIRKALATVAKWK